MGEPVKPFACNVQDCGMTFTNEDHLNVHTKKHDMVLQLGSNQRGHFVADQTPTPTRFIRNCEEVGLFQDLQSVNPFDEGFKRAVESKAGMLLLDNAIASATADDALHTPHIFPNLGEASENNLFQTTQKITRSSSDENNLKYGQNTVSKLTNEITTISKIIEIEKDIFNEKVTHEEVRTDIIKFHSNVEIRKADFDKNDASKNPIITTDVIVSDNKITDDRPSIISQKSLEFAIDSLSHDTFGNANRNVPKAKVKEKNDNLIQKMRQNLQNALSKNVQKEVSSNVPIPNKNVDTTNSSNIINKQIIDKSNSKKRKSIDNEDALVKDTDSYEVMIKLPTGKTVHIKAVGEIQEKNDTKQKLKESIENKSKKEIQNPTYFIQQPLVTNIYGSLENGQVIKMANQSIKAGTLVPVTVLNPTQILMGIPYGNKVAIPADKNIKQSKTNEKTKNSITGYWSKRLAKRIGNSTTQKVTHKSNCDILSKLGGMCSCLNENTSEIETNNRKNTETNRIPSVNNASRINENNINLKQSPVAQIQNNITASQNLAVLENLGPVFPSSTLVRQNLLTLDQLEKVVQIDTTETEKTLSLKKGTAHQNNIAVSQNSSIVKLNMGRGHHNNSLTVSQNIVIQEEILDVENRTRVNELNTDNTVSSNPVIDTVFHNEDSDVQDPNGTPTVVLQNNRVLSQNSVISDKNTIEINQNSSTVIQNSSTALQNSIAVSSTKIIQNIPVHYSNLIQNNKDTQISLNQLPILVQNLPSSNQKNKHKVNTKMKDALELKSMNEKRKFHYMNGAKDKNWKSQSKNAASKRYRDKNKVLFEYLGRNNLDLTRENKNLNDELTKARNEIADLKLLFTNHSLTCKNSEELKRQYQEILLKDKFESDVLIED